MVYKKKTILSIYLIVFYSPRFFRSLREISTVSGQRFLRQIDSPTNESKKANADRFIRRDVLHVSPSDNNIFIYLFISSSPTSSNAFRDFKPVLVFHVFDWDRITKDDLAGEAIFSLSSVPFVTSEAEVDGLKQTMMPLWLPPQPNGEIFRVIEGRTWDKEAVEFVKVRKKLGKMER